MNAATIRHEPYEECDGTPARLPAWASPRGAFHLRPDAYGDMLAVCPDCHVSLCWCEMACGHDCEE